MIMAEVNDEATNALIASMLAEDNHYTEYDAYNMGPDSEDDDWGGSKRSPRKGESSTLKLAGIQARLPYTHSSLSKLLQLECRKEDSLLCCPFFKHILQVRKVAEARKGKQQLQQQ